MDNERARDEKAKKYAVTRLDSMYDYIVIGAGSAGTVVAARLSEDPASSVLVLESGPHDDLPEIAMPAATPTLWSGPLTWDNATVPQQHAAQRVIPWPSGRTLGGSSSINGMIYVRGNKIDYDNWRDTYGCAGWGYLNILPTSCEPKISNAAPLHTTAPVDRCA